MAKNECYVPENIIILAASLIYLLFYAVVWN